VLRKLVKVRRPRGASLGAPFRPKIPGIWIILMHFRSLTVIVTLRCTAQCAHCVMSSSPDRVETIEAGFAAHAVEEAAQAGLSIVMSGGEPLLEFELVADLARRASNFGVSVAVYSNAYWGRIAEQATRMVERLRSSGVDTLLLSTDVYHSPFVPLKAVEYAARAAVAAGMHCEIAVPSPADDAVTSGEIAARLKDLPKVLVKVHLVSRRGRAVQLGSQVFAHGVYDRPCPVLGQLAVMPDGYLYACCAGSIQFGRDGVLCGGNLAEVSLRSAMSKWESLPLLSDIQRMGPLQAAVREAGRNPDFSYELGNLYSDLCDECHDVCRSYEQRQNWARVQEV